MLFNEIYGRYFTAVARVLECAASGELTREKLNEIVSAEGFAESILTIPANLTSGAWPLLTQNLETPLQKAPTMPLTLLQKRWLKTILQDPRCRLFNMSADGLEAVEPLYPPDTFVYYDRYLDGDPFDDPGYISRFQTILQALREKRLLSIRYRTGANASITRLGLPRRLEYSSKDDKFRLLCVLNGKTLTVNVGRIEDCKLLSPWNGPLPDPIPEPKDILVLELEDTRNTLERAMLHFSHLEKQAVKLDDSHYRLTLHYSRADETELLIRVLSFGPTVHVVSPEHFRAKLRQRLEKQTALLSAGGESF